MKSKLLQQETLFFGALIVVTLFFSLYSPLGHFTATPKYWWDESFTVETARTILEIGKIDITVEPSTPSQIAVALNANGFPLSIPLAGFFALFGISLEVVRIYMIGWILLTIAALYFFLKKIFGLETALAGTLLVITFASFYANGRTATGDIPGFFFLLLGLYAIYKKESFFAGGILFGLSTITKTSLFHVSLPAITFAILYTYRKKSLSPIFSIGVGAFVVGLVWIYLLAPHPLSLHSLDPALNFYKNPINKASLLDRLPGSASEILLSPTLIYFVILFLIIAYGYKQKAYTESQKKLLVFLFIYSFLQLIVFLRSPGWIRYLLAVQLFILSCIYPALKTLIISTLLHKKNHAFAIILLLAFLQSVQYMFFSNIFSIAHPLAKAEIINNYLAQSPNSTVGFINDPLTAAFISGNRKYQLVRVGGDTYAGVHPLSLPSEKLPTYMANYDPEYKNVFDTYYEKIDLSKDTILYRRKGISKL